MIVFFSLVCTSSQVAYFSCAIPSHTSGVLLVIPCSLVVTDCFSVRQVVLGLWLPLVGCQLLVPQLPVAGSVAISDVVAVDCTIDEAEDSHS